VVTSGTILTQVKNWGPWLVRQIGALLRGMRIRTRENLRIVPNDRENRWVGLGSYDGHPAMQVLSHWFVTNLSPGDERIIKVRFTRRLRRVHWWSLRGPRQVTEAITFDFVIGNRGAGQVIRSHDHLDLHAMFFVKDPLPEGHPLRGLTTFVDHLGEEYEHRTTYPSSIAPILERRS
jgi:hypothetical protein